MIKKLDYTKERNKEMVITKDTWNSIFNKLTLHPGTEQLASYCSFVRVDDKVIYLSMPEEKLNLFNGEHRQELQEKLSEYLKEDCNIFLEEGELNFFQKVVLKRDLDMKAWD